MKKIVFVMVVFVQCVAFNIQAQSNGRFNLKGLEMLTQDSSSNYFYPTLLDRFMKNDTTMSNDDMILLLVGYTQTKEYLPADQVVIEDSLSKLNKAGQYTSAALTAANYLALNPVSLSANLDMAFAQKNGKNEKLYNKYTYRALRIIQATLSTGTGNSMEDAIYVLSPKDIYLMLPLQNLTPVKVTDIKFKNYLLKEVKVRDAKNKVKTLYFNISSSLEAWMQRDTEN